MPRPLTSFIGRERELAEARRLLEGSCLLTLTGPGGSGKTRLCMELAAAVASDYRDGVYFVRLAPVREPDLVPSSIAQGIGLPDSGGRPLVEHLASYLRDRKLLLVLDNFEHLLAAAARISADLPGPRGKTCVQRRREAGARYQASRAASGVRVVRAPAEIDVNTSEQLRAVLLDAGKGGHATIVVT